MVDKKKVPAPWRGGGAEGSWVGRKMLSDKEWVVDYEAPEKLREKQGLVDTELQLCRALANAFFMLNTFYWLSQTQIEFRVF